MVPKNSLVAIQAKHDPQAQQSLTAEERTVTPVRFLIDEQARVGNKTYEPWQHYTLPKFVLDRLGLPYEVLPSTPLKVGTRLQLMIRAFGLSRKAGCCNRCSATQQLMDNVSESWIMEHLDELTDRIKHNAKDKTLFPVPATIIKESIKGAILIERYLYRRRNKELLGKQE